MNFYYNNKDVFFASCLFAIVALIFFIIGFKNSWFVLLGLCIWLELVSWFMIWFSIDDQLSTRNGLHWHDWRTDWSYKHGWDDFTARTCRKCFYHEADYMVFDGWVFLLGHPHPWIDSTDSHEVSCGDYGKLIEDSKRIKKKWDKQTRAMEKEKKKDFEECRFHGL